MTRVIEIRSYKVKRSAGAAFPRAFHKHAAPRTTVVRTI
jgi:hypothetical protein